MRLTKVFFILLLLSAATQVIAAQIVSGPTPPDIRGFHTTSGMRLSSENPANSFTLDIDGRTIQPISTSRLLWRVDDKEVELSIGRRPWILPDSASDSDTLHAYLDDSAGNKASRTPEQHVPFVESFECEAGRTCALWNVVKNGRTTWTAAAVNGNNIILLSAAAVQQPNDDGTPAWLKTAFLTLRRGKTAPAKSTEPPSKEGGTSLQSQINFWEALVGKAYVAFINRSLMTASDAAVPKAIPLSSSAMIEVAKFMLCADRKLFPMSTDAPTRANTPILTVSVFDGSLAHAINLEGWDSTTGVFKYWDPWGQSSFLAQGNNHAEIAATPHPTEKRMWLVKGSDLQRVVYSMVLMESQAIAVIRLAALLQGPDLVMVDTYRTLRLENSDDPEIADARFADIAAYLMENKQVEAALKIDNVRLSVYPERATVLTQSLSSALRAAGRPDLSSRVAVLGVGDSAQAPLMHDIPSAQKEDFFHFFHLVQTAEEPTAGGGRVVRFHPSGPKFRDIVEVTVDEQSSGMVSAWSVLIAQSMIDDPTNRIFASDIAKSFLQFMVPDAGDDAVARMAQEIWSTKAGERPEVQLPGAPIGVTIPSIPSLAYLTFVGAHESYIVPLRGAQLRLGHVRQPTGDWLQISVFTPRQNGGLR